MSHPDGLYIVSEPENGKDVTFEARILAFAHKSDWLIDAPVTTAQTIAERLLDGLVKHRRKHRCVPIVFIAHTFGGIIIKEPGNDAQEIVDSARLVPLAIRRRNTDPLAGPAPVHVTSSAYILFAKILRDREHHHARRNDTFRGAAQSHRELSTW
ncbi:hypothetical protein MY5147_006526 [Beauveria neobassiana]